MNYRLLYTGKASPGVWVFRFLIPANWLAFLWICYTTWIE